VGEIFAFPPQEVESLDFSDKNRQEITDAVWALALNKYETKEKLIDEPAILHRVERDIMLQIVDAQWKDHLYSLDHLKEGIGLRGYGQRDPLVEYKKESFELFTAMKDRIEEEIVRYLWRLMPVVPEEGMPTVPAPVRPAPRKPSPVTLSGPGTASAAPFGAIRGGGSAAAVAEPPPTSGPAAALPGSRATREPVGFGR
jgi:preprotein translocase subunit SecA